MLAVLQIIIVSLGVLLAPTSIFAQDNKATAAPAPSPTATPTPATAPTFTGQIFTLQSALDQAIKNYPGLEIVHKSAEIAERQLAEARHSWILPQFEVTSFFGPVPDVPASAGPPGFQNYVETPNDVGGIFFRLEANAVQPIFTFGRLKNVTRLAKTGVKASLEEERDEMHELVFNIKRTYFGMAGLYTLEDFLHEIEGKLNFVAKRIDEMLEKGTSDVTESDRFKVQIFSADLAGRLLEAQENQQKVRYAMSLLLGFGDKSDGWDIDVHNVTTTAAEQYDLESSMKWATANNANLQRLNYLVEARKSLKDIQQANFMPILFLGGTFAYAIAPDRFDVENPYLNDPFNEVTGGVALGMRQELDLHILRDRYLKTKLEYEQALFQKRLAEDAIKADVRGKVLTTDLSQQRLNKATEGLRAARSLVGAEMNNYEFGVAPTKDVLEAFIAYAKAKLDFIDTTVKYNLAVAGLTRVTFRELMPIYYKGDGR